MSPHGRPISVGPPRAKGRLKDELRALKSLVPYLWPRDSFELRARVVLAVAFLLVGKLVKKGKKLVLRGHTENKQPASLRAERP